MNPVLDLPHIYSITGIHVSLHSLTAEMENFEAEYAETVNTVLFARAELIKTNAKR